jgi:hypothetical protein
MLIDFPIQIVIKNALLSGALVKVVIPRPDPRGLPVGGVGKVSLV